MFVSTAITAQNTDLQTMLKKGGQLRLTYEFDEALGIFNKLLQQKTDSVFRSEVLRQIMLCENGKNMLKFTATPTVITYKTVTLKDFYRYYDLALSGYWSLTPASLLKEQDINEIKPFIYITSKDPEVIYFDTHGAENKSGWDIYESHRMPNNEWSAPERLSDVVNTSFDERYPYLCPDGLTLYFASNGHYGMGGYDLYKTVKDPETGTWSTPENLGFPFSSTADDIVYVPDNDNIYACFASTRNNEKDSLTIYKIALEGTPIKQSLSRQQDIIKAAALHPVAGIAAPQKDSSRTPAAKDDSPEADYRLQIQELQKLQQRSVVAQQELDKLRTEYSKSTNAQERKTIAIKIDTREQTLSQYQQDTRQLNKKIQDLEYTLLAQGIVPTAISAPPTPEKTRTMYSTVQTTLLPHPEKIITLPDLTVQAPINTVPAVRDFTLRSNTESQLFENEPVEGISYRFQVGVFSKKPDAAIFKGYSPVFLDEHNGKWICGIGSFRTYGEAQKHINAMKRDFKNPVIAAYKDSKPIEVKQARLEEGKKPATATTATNKNVAYQVLLGETLPENLFKAVQQATSKELARTSTNGKTLYVVGPYASKDEADKVVQVLQQSGFKSVSIEAVEKK